MRLIEADELEKYKFEIQSTRYKDGWNDAIDHIMQFAPTIEPYAELLKRLARHAEYHQRYADYYADHRNREACRLERRARDSYKNAIEFIREYVNERNECE